MNWPGSRLTSETLHDLDNKRHEVEKKRVIEDYEHKQREARDEANADEMEDRQGTKRDRPKQWRTETILNSGMSSRGG